MSKLLDFIRQNGRAPQVSLVINPLDPKRPQIILTQFLTYQFQTSILIPVDAFSFTFTMPQVKGSISDFIQEGDLCQLQANQVTICTGIVDTVDIETTLDGGDVVLIMGRNLLSQLEDQSTVNTVDKPIWGTQVSVQSAVGAVIQNTRIPGLRLQNPLSGTFLFATEPGETKLSALSRFVEPLNCLLWGDPSGKIVVGRPNMSQDPLGTLVCDRDNRNSNVFGIKAIRNSTQIPNIVLPIWTGQETVQARVSPEQRMLNMAEGPKRLRQFGHLVQRAVVVSTPSGSDPQSLSDINAIKVGGSNLLQAYAAREIARANLGELTVQAMVKSHYNDDIVPFNIDQVFNVNYPRGGVQQKMYLYQAEYSCDVENGPRTSLHFCKLGCIVAGTPIAPIAQKLVASSKLAQT